MAFMVPWMDFIMARVILGEQNVHLHTTAVGLYYMLYGQRVDSNVFTMFSAGCLLIAVPIVSLFLSMQKFYVEGITAGSVKS
jgi:arabinogalactan oligomer/maltooligosaccharide transport system permease protein